MVGLLGYPYWDIQGQELDLMTLMGPFQLCDSVPFCDFQKNKLI